MRVLRWTVVACLLAISATPARAANVTTTVTRIAASVEGNSLQLFLATPIEAGSCAVNYKVALGLGTPLTNVVTSLGTTAFLTKKRVEIGYDNTKVHRRRAGA
jgi:hypothetical protein